MMVATYPPPRGPDDRVASVLFWMVVVVLLYLGGAFGPARADPLPVIGYRLEVGVCQPAGCQAIFESDAPWPAKRSCEIQGDLLLESVRQTPGGPSVQVRCVPVRGLRSA